MAEQSFTGTINTLGDFSQLSTLTSLTFSNDVTYTIFINGVADVKVGNAVFPGVRGNVYFTPSSGSSNIYVRTNGNVPFTIYGN